MRCGEMVGQPGQRVQETSGGFAKFVEVIGLIALDDAEDLPVASGPDGVRRVAVASIAQRNTALTRNAISIEKDQLDMNNFKTPPVSRKHPIPFGP